MDCEIVIIGSGVIGLSIAYELSKKFDDIYVIEKDTTFGQSISSRNSEVIHSGIYYPKNSLKSSLCLRGSKLLYDYCDLNNIPYKRCGKIIVASSIDDKQRLIDLKKMADDKNIENSFLDRGEINQKEPNVQASYGLFIKNSGILDSHAFMASINQKNISNGVQTAYKTFLKNVVKISGGYKLEVINPDFSKSFFSTRVLINSAGLTSYKICQDLGITDEDYQVSYWKGEYFWLAKKSKDFLKSLIYPLPDNNLAGLGIHTTMDVNGRIKLGPSTNYLGEKLVEDYSVNVENRKKFYDAAKIYLKNISMQDLQPDYSGIRPKLQKPNEGFKDFVICNEKKRGFNNFINLIGIESPGLTSCLSIAEYVCQIIYR